MNKKFLSNTAWIIGGQIIKNVLGFVVSIFTASYLGPSNYGLIGYVTSIITLFTAFANLGLGNIVVKEILANKDNEGSVIGTAITLQTISSFIAYMLVIGTVILFNIDNKTMWICAVLQGFSLVLMAYDHIGYYYQSRLESRFSVIITLIAYILVQVYKIILLYFKKSVEWFAFANTLDFLLIAIALIISYCINRGPKWKFSKNIAKTLIKQSYPFIIAGMFSVLYASLDKIMLKEMLQSTDAVGYYNVAYKIGTIWIFVINALITSFSPLIYEAAQKYGIESETYKTRLRQMYFLVFWLGVCASLAIDVIAPFLIPWAYKGKYDLSIEPTMILTWAGIFSYLGVARGIQFVCENKQKYIGLFSAITVVINATLNYFLIPIKEASGAAIATVISEIVVCLLAPMLSKQTRNISFLIIEGICFRGIRLNEIISIIKRKIRRTNKDNKDKVDLDEKNDDEIL